MQIGQVVDELYEEVPDALEGLERVEEDLEQGVDTPVTV